METIDIEQALSQNISVLEGLMKPMLDRGYCADARVEYRSGVYMVDSKTQDLGDIANYGSLIVFNHSPHKTQLYMPLFQGKIYIRSHNSSKWSSWMLANQV